MPPTAVATARPGTEAGNRRSWRTKSEMHRRNKLDRAARKRQAKAKKAHNAKLRWFKAWRKKKLAAINATGRSAAWKRKSRNKVNSKYNSWRAAEIKKFRRITANNYSPRTLTQRTEGDIFEHYDIHRLFSSDLSISGINDIVAGEITGSTPFIQDEYGTGLNEEYDADIPSLNLGITDLTPYITWVEVFDDTGNRTWTANIDIPNSSGFYDVKVRISG